MVGEPIIQFKDFGFQYYSQAEPTLYDINLTIRKGEKVLIEGPSGSGKSTLGHCLNGLIPFAYNGEMTGSLTIGGKETKECNIFKLSKTVGTVLQDSDGQFVGLTVGEDIAFALENAAWADAVIKGIEEGLIPVRVTHNDTKINNILFDEVTSKAVCVIDLDTVMPGSMLYDFGDALRMGGSTAAEDETDLNKVWFDEKAFEAFAKGYMSEMKEALTEEEIRLLPLSAKLMTYECGIRFLTDYLNGDTYFKIHREHHNLDRARNQFKLVADITAKEGLLAEIIKGM